MSANTVKAFLYRVAYFLGLALFTYDLVSYSTKLPVEQELYLKGVEHNAMALGSGIWIMFAAYITVFSFYHFIVNRQKPVLLWLALLLVPGLGAYVYLEKFIARTGLLTNLAWGYKLTLGLSENEIARTSIKRLGAALFDYTLYLAFAVIFALISVTPNTHGTRTLVDNQSLPLVLMWCAYFPVAEFICGRTLGKHIFGLKVVHGDGSRVSIVASFRRHAVDIIDVFFFVVICFVRVGVSNKLPRRLGDYWGHTWVIPNMARGMTKFGNCIGR